ncbi:MAG: amidophosphoribosyltransferase [Nanoarchaeota archaeon]|nr:amidophosphoribosyltransferase [Nanoarchaeota archaeon]
MSGIVGVASEIDCLQDAYFAADYHSHCGTEYGGIAVSDGERVVRRVHSIRRTQFKSKFDNDIDFQTFHGNKAIGVVSDRDYQPIIAKLKFGDYAIAGAGYIDNQDDLANKLISEGESFTEVKDGKVNQIELASKLINKGDNLIDGINKMNSQIDGSMSLILLNKNGIYAARAKYGHTPLTLAEKTTEGKKSQLVALATCSYKNLGFKIKRFLGPNEIIYLDGKNEKQLQKPGELTQLCAFLYIYTGFPSSEVEGLNIAEYREKAGRIMAQRENVKLDGIWGVQDSGLIYAFGFANESKVPIAPVAFKYTPGWGRSYTPPTQKLRDLIATMKQIAVSGALIDGKILGITEDSIVRGTQLENFYLAKLWTEGAKGLHIRPACPSLMYPCKDLFSTRSTDELFARKVLFEINGRNLSDIEIKPYLDTNSEQYDSMIKLMEERMMKNSLRTAGLNPEGKSFSLRYQKLEDMIELTGKKKENLCTYCWDGCRPQRCSKGL